MAFKPFCRVDSVNRPGWLRGVVPLLAGERVLWTEDLFVRLSPEMKDEFRDVCNEQGRYMSEVVRALIRGFLEDARG